MKKQNMKMKKYIIEKVNNLSLYTKILFVVLSVAALILSATLIGLRLISNANNLLLYKTLAGSLSYSAEDISKKLNNIENMTDIMIADSDIQDNLAVVADSGDISQRNAAYDGLSYKIPDYYQNYRDNSLYFLNLYNPDYVIYSYRGRSNQIPDPIIEDCLTAAEENPGYPCWITEYGSDYGLFLSRTIRRASQLRLDYLGTLLVSVNLDELIDSATSSVVPERSMGYLLFDGDTEIYRSGSLLEEPFSTAALSAEDNYGVVKIEGAPYFYIRGQIPDYGWDYFCLMEYSSFASTQRTALTLCLFVIAVLTLAGVLLSRFFISSITDHFQNLIKKMKQFGKDETVLPESGYDYDCRQDEIGQIHQQFDSMAVKIQGLIRDNYVKEILAKEAKLKALENQINPHFLYNTLDVVYWRAKVSGDKTISTMIEALASLLRATLSKESGSSTLKRELDLVHSYMTIQKIRFEDRLQYSEDVSEDILGISLPQLTLQPLVENAITYGLEEMLDTCCIRIHGYRMENEICIDVINNGSQFEEDLLHKLETNEIVPRGFGIGLLNIHRRLSLIYGDGYGLILFNSDEEHAVARIRIPKGPDTSDTQTKN